MKTIQTCFPGGTHKALSLSYDDGQRSDRRLVEMFNEAGLKGTFHLNSGFLGNRGMVTVREAAALYDGHEVASHTLSHPALPRCANEQIIHQVLEDRKRLEDIVGYAVRGLAYPFGSWNREIAALLPGLGIEYARLVESSGMFIISDNFLAWKPTCHHNQNLLEHARRFMELAGNQNLLWFSVWGHSFEFDRQGNWDVMEEFCRTIGKREDVWYTTVIGMIDYMKAAKGIRMAVSGDFAENPSSRPVWLTVDGAIVEIPAGGTVRL
jgi:peptidoglycan/xylan/chitin deacetylase (PgdA/CDA1 family)